MSSRPVHHDTFVIERTYPSPPSRVFRALTDPAAKAQWFLPPGDWKASGYRFDCRVGGTEHVESRPPGGEPHVYDAVYHDVLADRRVVFSYDMHLGEQHLSVSLTTIELEEFVNGCHDDLVMNVRGTARLATQVKKSEITDWYRSMRDLSEATMCSSICLIVVERAVGIVILQHELRRDGETHRYETVNRCTLSEGRLASWFSYPMSVLDYAHAWGILKAKELRPASIGRDRQPQAR